MNIELGPIIEVVIPEIARLAANPAISKTSGVPTNCDEAAARDWYKVSITSNPIEVHFVIYLDSKPIGCCIYKKIDWQNRNAELSFWIGQEFWNQGFTTLAGELARDLAFERYQMNFLHSHHLRDNNPASGLVLSKLGFKPDTEKADIPVEGWFSNFAPDVWTFSVLDFRTWLDLKQSYSWRIRKDSVA